MTELGDYSSFEETLVADKVAEKTATAIFDIKYQHILTRMEKQEQTSNNIIFGSMIATVLVLTGLILSTWLFIQSYSQHFSEVENDFQKAVSDLRRENFEFKTELMQLRPTKDR